MPYFAQIDPASVVLRVVVADSVAWCVDNLGGTWVETADPYSPDQPVAYCGPGWGFDARYGDKFAPPWRQPLGADVAEASPYLAGRLVFHNGRIWRSLLDNNVWEPGVANWRDTPSVGYPVWVQPTGAHDAYALGDRVEHKGQVWENTGSASNVWEPGVFGWVVVDTSEAPDVTLTDAPLWVAGTSYGRDQLVTWLGAVWRSTRNANRSEPGVDGNWQTAVI